MISLNLDKFLSGHVFAFVFIFARLGSILMLMPGIGEVYVPARIRLLLAFCMSFLLMPVLMPRLPAAPEDISALAAIICFEVVVGIFFGTLLRLIMDALETAGTIISLQSGLSNATVLNPTLAAQSPLPSALLGLLGSTLIFLTGLDHLLLRSILATYDIFPAGGTVVPGDMAQMIIQTMARSFTVGVQLAMPFLLMGLMIFSAIGLIQRLMPMIQLFMISVPVQIWGGLFLLSVTVSSIMAAWLHYFDETLSLFGSR